MVEITRDKIQQKNISGDCTINMTIKTSTNFIRKTIKDVIEDTLYDGDEVIGWEDGIVMVNIGDRAWSRIPWMYLDHVRDVYALERVNIEDQETEEAIADSVRDVTANLGAVRDPKTRNLGGAELVLEVTWTREMTDEEFEDLWSQHILDQDSINNEFTTPEVHDEKNVTFTGSTEEIFVDDYQAMLQRFKGDFPVSDSKISCRPI